MFSFVQLGPNPFVICGMCIAHITKRTKTKQKWISIFCTHFGDDTGDLEIYRCSAYPKVNKLRKIQMHTWLSTLEEWRWWINSRCQTVSNNKGDKFQTRHSGHIVYAENIIFYLFYIKLTNDCLLQRSLRKWAKNENGDDIKTGNRIMITDVKEPDGMRT